MKSKWIVFATLSASVLMVMAEGSAFAAARHTTSDSLPTVWNKSIIAKAKAEGMIHGFGMPANWANLGNMWAAFSKTYGIQSQYVAEGNMSSAEELQAFQKEKNNAIGDVGDIGISFGPTAVQMGVVAPFKNQYWNQIPANLKDPHGNWAAAYYGVISFEVNPQLVKQIPHTWSDLLKPEYKGLIGFGDPRQAAEQFDAVIAASYAFGGNAQNIQPGINFFKKLHQSGNWAGATGSTAAMKTGQIGIQITWNYLSEADAAQFAGRPQIDTIVPSDSTVAGPYVEVINKYAPHPYAARLLNNYLFSNAGQISYARGGAYPVRLKYLKLPKTVKLPPLNLNKVHFLSGSFAKATNTLNAEWGSQVLGQ
jgi:putative spermidine/putrescine transport system substrate-binding protein